MTAFVSRALRDLHDRYPTGLAPVWDPNTGLTTAIKVPAATKLAPVRTRCKKCSKALGDLVVLQLFCTYACADLPTPDTNPDTAPRECKRAARSNEPGDWVLKNKFVTAKDAKPYLKTGTNVYRCSNCFFLHIGNASAPPPRGIALAPTATGNDLLTNCVLALLHTRGESVQSPSAVAAAKRDARTVLETVKAHQKKPVKRSPSAATKTPTRKRAVPVAKPAAKKARPKSAPARKATPQSPTKKAAPRRASASRR